MITSIAQEKWGVDINAPDAKVQMMRKLFQSPRLKPYLPEIEQMIIESFEVPDSFWTANGMPIPYRYAKRMENLSHFLKISFPDQETWDRYPLKEKALMYLLHGKGMFEFSRHGYDLAHAYYKDFKQEYVDTYSQLGDILPEVARGIKEGRLLADAAMRAEGAKVEPIVDKALNAGKMSPQMAERVQEMEKEFDIENAQKGIPPRPPRSFVESLEFNRFDNHDWRLAGHRLRAYFENKGYGDFNQYAVETMIWKVTPYGPRMLVKAAKGMWSLTDGNLQNRLLINWVYGTAHVLHLRALGMHNSNEDNILLDYTGRRFIQDLLNLPEAIGNRKLDLNFSAGDRVEKRRSRYTYRQLMLWGLKMMLDPRVHDPDIKNKDSGPVTIDEKYLLRMLTFAPDGRRHSKKFIREKIMPLLAEALSMKDADFQEIGLDSIWHQINDYYFFRPNGFTAKKGGLSHKNSPFDIALPTVLPSQTQHKDPDRKKYEDVYFAKYPDPEALQEEFFFTRPKFREIFYGLEEKVQHLRKQRELARFARKRGGIDLTSDKALSVQNSNQGIKFHIDPAMLQQLHNAPGFEPMIVSMEPLEDLRGFLGAQ